MVAVEMSPNASSRTSSPSPLASSVNPSEQVPRNPNVSQPEMGVSVTPAFSQITMTWSLGALSAVRRAVATIASAYCP